MAFDESKDVTITAIMFDGKKGSTIELKAASYNGGAPQLQISRFEETDDGKKKFLKLGRLTLDEATSLQEHIGIILSSVELRQVQGAAVKAVNASE